MSDAEMDAQANEFAMHLLVPTDLLKKELKDRHIDIESSDKIKKLARKFQVSEQLMTIRIGQIMGVKP